MIIAKLFCSNLVHNVIQSCNFQLLSLIIINLFEIGSSDCGALHRIVMFENLEAFTYNALQKATVISIRTISSAIQQSSDKNKLAFQTVFVLHAFSSLHINLIFAHKFDICNPL